MYPGCTVAERLMVNVSASSINESFTATLVLLVESILPLLVKFNSRDALSLSPYMASIVDVLVPFVK